MTDDEFKNLKKKDVEVLLDEARLSRHAMQNLAAQRDDSAAKIGELQKKVAGLKQEKPLEKALAKIKELEQKMAAMEAHPDVIAARKAKAVADAKARLAAALKAKEDAETILAAME